MGIFSAFSNIFGSTQAARGFESAINQLQQIREQNVRLAREEGRAINALFDPFTERAGSFLDESGRVLSSAITGTEALVGDTGLSEQERILFEDVQRIQNENLSRTGNLRSGAAAFANAELSRRVFADAIDRKFNELTLLGNLGRSVADLGQISGNLGLGGRQLSTNLTAAAIGSNVRLGESLANAEIGRGIARGQQITSVGGFLDQVLNTGVTFGANKNLQDFSTRFSKTSVAPA